MRNPGHRRDSGFSLIELLIVVAIILVILTIAVPSYNKILMGARETKAIATIQTIHTAQRQYYSNYARFGSLRELGPPASGGAGPSGSELIDRELASGEKGGYKFSVVGDAAGYRVTATPDVYLSSGSKTYFSDQSMAIHEHAGPEPAAVNDRLVGEAAPLSK